MGFIADSSVVLSWLLEDETSAAVDALMTERWARGADIHAPTLLLYEVTNVLVICHTRRNRLTCEQVWMKMKDLDALDIAYDDPCGVNLRIVHFAVKYKLSAYDAAYLKLAVRLALPLATLDDTLREAVQSEGLKLLPT